MHVPMYITKNSGGTFLSASLRDVWQEGVLPNGIEGLIKMSLFYHTIPAKTIRMRNPERDIKEAFTGKRRL